MQGRVMYSVLIIAEDTAQNHAIASFLERDRGYLVHFADMDLLRADAVISKEEPQIVLVLVQEPSFLLKNWILRMTRKLAVPTLIACNETVLQARKKEEMPDELLIERMPVRKDHSPEMVARELAIKIALMVNRSSAHHKRDTEQRALAALQKPLRARNFSADKLIAVGASMGGVEALSRVLEVLPAEMPGIVVVQHMPKGFTEMYAKQLDRNCKLKVVQAGDRQRVEQNTVYIAPGDFHMEILKVPEGGYAIHVRHGDRVTGHRPSVDVLFHSVAQSAGRDALGVILTGMGEDGAKGLLEMRKAGADTVGQDADTALVYGMPRVAFEKGAVCKQLPLMAVPRYMVEYAYR